MKKLVIIFIPMLYSLTSFGQQIKLSENANMTPPKNMRKLSTAQVSSLVTNKFKTTKYLASQITADPQYIYQIDNLVVCIATYYVNNSKEYLKILKMGLDENGRLATNWHSKIETIGNADVLIIDENSEGFKLYRFWAVNNSGPGRMVGFVQYNAGEEVKARGVLEDVIKGIKFKIQ